MSAAAAQTINSLSKKHGSSTGASGGVAAMSDGPTRPGEGGIHLLATAPRGDEYHTNDGHGRMGPPLLNSLPSSRGPVAQPTSSSVKPSPNRARPPPRRGRPFYHSEEVLSSDCFFLVGRGGHGNFHRGNRNVRSLVAQHAQSYVETPRKDRAQLSIHLYDHHPYFQQLLFVTPRDYVLPRLEKDRFSIESEKKMKQKQKSMPKFGDVGVSSATSAPSAKRWLSQTRTESILDQHSTMDHIRGYPSGVYIEVGREWAIDIVDHLLREQAHEIRKKHGTATKGSNSVSNRSGSPQNASSTERRGDEISDAKDSAHAVSGTRKSDSGGAQTSSGRSVRSTRSSKDQQPTRSSTRSSRSNRGAAQSKTEEVSRTNGHVEYPVSDAPKQKYAYDGKSLVLSNNEVSSASAASPSVLASPDVVEAVEGLKSLWKSESAVDNDYSSKPAVHFEGEEVAHKEYTTAQDHHPIQFSNPGRMLYLGRDIRTVFPNEFHFVCDCDGFSVLDNSLFQSLVDGYFQEAKEEDRVLQKEWEEMDVRITVQRHISPILERANLYAQSYGKGGFRMWTILQDSPYGSTPKLVSENDWPESKMQEVTEDHAVLHARLEDTVRSILIPIMIAKYRIPVMGPSSNGFISDNRGKVSHSYSLRTSKHELQDSLVTTAGDRRMTRKRALDESNRPCNQDSSGGGHRETHNLPSSCSWHDSRAVSNLDSVRLERAPKGWVFCQEQLMHEIMNRWSSHTSSSLVSVLLSQWESVPEDQMALETAKLWRRQSDETQNAVISGQDRRHRIVLWIDASTEDAFLAEVEQITQCLRQEPRASDATKQDQSSLQPPDKVARLDKTDAVKLFYETLGLMSHNNKFVLICQNAAHPRLLAHWLQIKELNEAVEHQRSVLSGILIVPQYQAAYESGVEGFLGIVHNHRVLRIPERRPEDDNPWWTDLPLSNLPPLLLRHVDQPSLGKLENTLGFDGSVVAMYDSTIPGMAGSLANQFARKWMQGSPTSRFGVWLAANDELTLAKSYIKAIRSITKFHDLSECEDTLLRTLSCRTLADELMRLFMHMRKHTPRFEFVVVYDNIPKEIPFQNWFCSGEADVWNSRGRFIFTSNAERPSSLKVEVNNAAGNKSFLDVSGFKVPMDWDGPLGSSGTAEFCSVPTTSV